MQRAAQLAADGRYELVLFQEVWTDSQIEAVENVLGDDYVSHHSGDEARPIIGLKGGLIVFARRGSEWNMDPPVFYEFENEAPDFLLWQGDGLADKGVQEIRLRNDRADVDVRVLNTHFQSPYSPEFLFNFRKVRGAQLEELLARTKSPELPTLAFGDLNLGPKSENYKLLLKDWVDLSASERERCQCDTHDGKYGGAADWIDYALGRDSADWKIQAEIRRLDRDDSQGMVSDHNGLSAVVHFERLRSSLTPADSAALLALVAPSTRRTWLIASMYLAARGVLGTLRFGVRGGGRS